MGFDPSTASPVEDGPVQHQPIASATSSFDPSSAMPVDAAQQGPQRPTDTFSRNLSSIVNQRDDGIDYHTGVEKALFRAGFSRMSNDEEKANYLREKAGSGNFGKDSFGAWYIKPDGLQKLGIKSPIPISIDEQRMTGYDLADWAGDVPALVGAAGFGLVSSGAGAIPGAALVGLGAMAGKAFDEILKTFQGYNKKSAGEMASDLAGEGAAAALGEGVFRGGARLLKGYSPGISEERKQMTRDALDAGLTPKTWQILEGQGPLLRRFQATSEKVLGDPTQSANREVLSRQAAGLAGRAGEPVDNIGGKLIQSTKDRLASMEVDATYTMSTARDSLNKSLEGINRSLGSPDPSIGARVPAEIRQARKQFGEQASALYSQVDNMVGDPFVPTASLKAEAQRIADQLPKTQSGRVIFTKSGEANPIEDILNLPDNITVGQAQRIRTMLRDGSEVRDLAPGVDKRDLGLLKNASEKIFDDAASALGVVNRSPIVGPDGQAMTSVKVLPADMASEAIAALKRADYFYKQGIQKFDAPAIASITREASQTGAVEPDRVLDYIIKPGYSSAVNRVKGLVSEETWSRVARAHFDDMLQNSTSLVNGGETVVGRKLYSKVQDMGKTLDAVYGKDAPAIRRYSAELAALDGRLDPSALGGTDFAKSLEAAVLKQRRLDDFLKDNYLSKLAKPGAEADQAAEYIFRPNSPARIIKAKELYGEGSEEFKGLQNAAMQKILSSFVERTDDPLVKVLNGASLRVELDRYGESTIKAAFGDELAKDLYKFASLAEFVTKKGPMGAGGIVAANVALHPVSNIGKIADIFVTSRLLRTPGVIRWLSEGINPDTPAKAAAAALARVSTIATVLVHDKTGSATTTFTSPPKPEQTTTE